MSEPDTRIRFREAWEALQRLRQDPDATGEVFVIIRAMSGKSGERQFQRFRRTPEGARILAERRDLLATLEDRAALEAMPEGSLGREYAHFTEREQISAAGLVEASEGVERERVDPDRARFFDRLRDCHDLEHVLTGYQRDLRGELSVLTLDTAQAWHHGIALIVGHAYWQGDPETRALVRAAWKRGKHSAWLSAVDWEAMLPRPLCELREELGLGDPPEYEPVWSEGAPAAA